MIATIATNAGMIGAVAIPAMIKMGSFDYKLVLDDVYRRMSAESKIIIANYSAENEIKKLNNEMNEPAEAWKDYIPLPFGAKLKTEISFDEKYLSGLKKQIIAQANGDIDELKRLNKMMRKTLRLYQVFKVFANVVYVVALQQQGSELYKDTDLSFYHLPELNDEDKQFVNSIAEYCWPHSTPLLYKDVEVIDIQNYNISRHPSKWDMCAILNDELVELFAQDILDMFGFTNKQQLPVMMDNKLSEVEEKELTSPIFPLDERGFAASPIIFIDKDKNKEAKHKLPDSTRAKYEYKVVSLDDMVTEEPETEEVEEDKEVEPFDYEKYQLPEEYSKNFVVSENATKIIIGSLEYIFGEDFNKYKFVINFTNPTANYFGANKFISVIDREADKPISEYFIDYGELFGGNRLSIITDTKVGGSLQPTIVDVVKSPEIAKKVLLNNTYLLSGEEVTKTLVNYSRDISIYRYIDLSNAGYIDKLSETDTALLFSNISQVIEFVNKTYGGTQEKLSLSRFENVYNFQLSNRMIIVGMRNGMVANFGTNGNVPYSSQTPSSPVDMFSMIQNGGINTVYSTGTNQPNNGMSFIAPGTFMPDFRKMAVSGAELFPQNNINQSPQQNVPNNFDKEFEEMENAMKVAMAYQEPDRTNALNQLYERNPEIFTAIWNPEAEGGFFR